MKKVKSIKSAFTFAFIIAGMVLLSSSCGTTKSGCPGAITMGRSAHVLHS